MFIWGLAIVIIAITKIYLDILIVTGTLPFGFWYSILIDIVLLCIAMGILYRIYSKERVGEKEILTRKIIELEEKLKKSKGRK